MNGDIGFNPAKTLHTRNPFVMLYVGRLTARFTLDAALVWSSDGTAPRKDLEPLRASFMDSESELYFRTGASITPGRTLMNFELREAPTSASKKSAIRLFQVDDESGELNLIHEIPLSELK